MVNFKSHSAKATKFCTADSSIYLKMLTEQVHFMCQSYFQLEQALHFNVPFILV